MRTKLLSLVLLAAVLLSACAAPTAVPTAVPPTSVPPTAVPATAAPTTAAAAAASPVPGTATPVTRTNPKEIILATTTSTRDSGLLDVLLPVFEQSSGYTVKMVAVGSGQALAMGQAGNADVLLVHSPAAEKKYMDGGYGINRLLVMHNDFLIVGPSDDPAKIKGLKSAVDAFKAIAAAQSTFVSRGDASGTNAAELAIWKQAVITPTKTSAWYLQTGQGMGDTLNVTSEKGSYTLTDRATYLAQKSHLQLDIMVQGDISLLNIYHVIMVNPDKWPLVNQAGAKAFSDFMVSQSTQDLIGKFGVDKYGQQLFYPDAGKNEADLGK
jgi:tungstate transport system substrate-binding protein